MKKKLFFVLIMAMSLSTSTLFAAEAASNNPANSEKNNKENKLTEEEVGRMTKRIEEIRDMDKSNLSAVEKSELRNELKDMKESVRANGGYVYIGVGTLILIIILVILLV
ncbi:MAG: hypothetical protein HGA37_02930 [Lentimicrobium sp.]|nr:hypothetical protein [Lentimicrobium sp.]